MKFLKIILFFVIVYLLSIFSTYFSMIDYKDTVSSSCLECSLFRDVLVFPFFCSVVLTIFFVFLQGMVKKRTTISGIIVMLFIAFNFLNNYYIFVDRVSAWSSFTLAGELMGIIADSYLYLLISAVVMYFVILKLNLETQRENIRLNQPNENSF